MNKNKHNNDNSDNHRVSTIRISFKFLNSNPLWSVLVRAVQTCPSDVELIKKSITTQGLQSNASDICSGWTLGFMTHWQFQSLLSGKVLVHGSWVVATGFMSRMTQLVPTLFGVLLTLLMIPMNL